MIFIMVFSVFGFSFRGRITEESSQGEGLEYNDFIFSKSDEFWILDYSNQGYGDLIFAFTYNPKETEEISITPSEVPGVDHYLGKPLYIYSENEAAKVETEGVFQIFSDEIKEACPDGENCDNMPSKNCENNFIIIKESDDFNGTDKKGEIIKKENCIYIKGKSEYLIMLTDEFLFKTLGIKE